MSSQLWANFVTSLESRGVSFQQLRHASERHAVILAAGFTNPIAVAIIETEWKRRIASDVASSTSVAQAASTEPSVMSAAVPPLPHFADYTKLEDVPEEIQDRVVATEVIAAVVGHGGSLLQASRDGFIVSRHVPVSMRGLCRTVIPVADAFVALRKIERAEYMGKGLVVMSLGEVVSEVCTSYAHQISNLQRWAKNKTMPLMGVVSEVLRAGHHIVRLRQVLPTDSVLEEEGTLSMAGWRLLNHIHEQAEKYSGSREDDELLLLLIRRVSVPYLRILHRWMHEGLLEDPYREFFISEVRPPVVNTSSAISGGVGSIVRHIFPNSSGADNHNETMMEDVIAFERRFTMNENMIPSFLQVNGKIAQMVLYTGKYCCLLREYNGSLPVFGDVAEDMFVWSGADKLLRKIEQSYEIASGAVLTLFLGSQVDLLGHLSSLKSYFLHQRGDWLVDFLDNAEELLAKSPVQVKVNSVRVLLQAAIARCCGTDPYHTSIGCGFADTTLEQSVSRSFEDPSDVNTSRESCGRRSAMRIEAHRCIELLQLEAELKWPLTMVIDPRIMKRLNTVFRLFTWLKACERNVTSSWTDVDTAKQYPKAYGIKHQLIQFIRQFQFYSAHFVVEPLWSRMIARIGQADSIFGVNNALQDFFEGVELGLVLSSANRFRSLSHILEIASNFSAMSRREFFPYLTTEQMQTALQGVEEKFLKSLSELASPVGADYPQLIPLLTWIDFSGFYDRSGVYRVLYAAGVGTETLSASTSEYRRR